MDKLNKIIKEALLDFFSKFKPGDEVVIKDDNHERYKLSQLYNKSGGKEGVKNKLVSNIYVVDNPPYDGNILNVKHKKTQNKGPKLNKDKWKKYVKNSYSDPNNSISKDHTNDFFFLNNLSESQLCKTSSLLNENLKHTHPISEAFRRIIDTKKPLIQEIKRINDVNLIREARILFDKGILNLPPKCQEYMNTSDFGKYKLKEGKIILEGLEDKSINTKFANVASQSLINLLDRHIPIVAITKFEHTLKGGLYDINLNTTDIKNIIKFVWDIKGQVNRNALKQKVRNKILQILEKS